MTSHLLSHHHPQTGERQVNGLALKGTHNYYEKCYLVSLIAC